MSLNEKITYDEMYKILYDKFKTTHDELRYWIKGTTHVCHSAYNISRKLKPYLCDIPLNDGIMTDEVAPLSGFFYPEYCFFNKKDVEVFSPSKCFRFVYLRDLTAQRNWYDYKIDEKHSKIFELLKHANEAGILRFYDTAKDDFSFHKILKNNQKKQLWCHTFDGEAYCANPNSFFLLYDILTLERVFFKKDLKLCLEELYGQSSEVHDTVPDNVIKLNRL